jgi:hypothetical protein
MPIIREMIFHRKIWKISGLLIFDDDDPASQYLLDQIERNERRRFEKRGTIPVQVLEVLWNWGIQLSTLPPEIGMSRGRFLESLWGLYKSCPDCSTRAAALYLYEDTVKSELMPRRAQGPSKFIKMPGEKAIPRSELKWIPGTII